MRRTTIKQEGARPAFPCSGSEGVNPEALGMDVRTWLTGQALVGIIASKACSEANPTFEDVARKAVAQADAVIKVLFK